MTLTSGGADITTIAKSRRIAIKRPSSALPPQVSDDVRKSFASTKRPSSALSGQNVHSTSGPIGHDDTNMKRNQKAVLIQRWYRKLHSKVSPCHNNQRQSVRESRQADISIDDAKNDKADIIIDYAKESKAIQPHSQSEYQPKMSELSVCRPADTADVRVVRIMDFLNTVKSEALGKSPSPKCTTQSGESPESVYGGVKAKMMGQQMEIEEKTRALIMLRKEVKRLKEQSELQQSNHQREMKSKLNLQRKEYEAIVKRHLAFIDKIISEKEEIGKRCESLVEECKTIEKQFKEKLQHQEEVHAREMKQKRELWESSEKIKRDKWIQEKSKTIKEQTIKGLEPEIQRMMAQHKTQTKRLEEQHKADLVRERELLAEQYQSQLEQMREKIAVERRRAAEEERDFARQRYQKQLEREEMEFQQQKRKLLAQCEEQKESIVNAYKAEKAEDDRSTRLLIDDYKRQVESLKAQKEEESSRSSRQHSNELKKIQEKYELEKEEWQAQLITKMELEGRNREKALRAKLVEERDAEIEMVIHRLENETSSNSTDLVRQHRTEIERLRSDHQMEIKQLKDQSSIAVDKILELQRQIGEFDLQLREERKRKINSDHELEAKETIIKEQQVELRRLRSDEQSLCDLIRRDFELNLEQKDQEIQACKKELESYERRMEREHASFEMQLSEIQGRKDRELNLVEEQVREALTLKDNLIESLKKKAEMAEMKSSQLELILEKQRQELLS